MLHVAELARQYEAGGGISFRGFVDELRLAAENAQAAEAPILEEGSDGVRLMTVHKAKGLEFPVVILADLTCKLARAEAGRWLDPAPGLCALKLAGWAPIDLLLHDGEEAARDKAEGERLAYVAATRARDSSSFPSIGDEPYDGGWLDPLTRAVYPPEAGRRDPAPAVGCGEFVSKDSVMNRPDGDPATPLTVAPGCHTFPAAPASTAEGTAARLAASGHEVVWWDPHVLGLGAASTFGLRRDDLIVRDGEPSAVAARLADHETWRARRAAILEQASVPGTRVQTATAWAAAAARDGVAEAIAATTPVAVVELPGAAGRPRGPRFGTLVHAVLATVPLDAAPPLVERAARIQGRLLLAGEEEVRAAALVVSAVLGHDLIARARAAAVVRRETPVTWLQDDGLLIEGVLDLAFDDGVEMTVVDFKTDHELSAGEARYRAQVQQYVAAVRRATGRPASGVLFKI